jgi:hypothetical protein
MGRASDPTWGYAIRRQAKVSSCVRDDMEVIDKGCISSHILKYKEWQDGEYVAVGVDVTTMRLPVDGVYAERKALANVWIEHKGTSCVPKLSDGSLTCGVVQGRRSALEVDSRLTNGSDTRKTRR